MAHVHFSNPEALASLRREYEEKVERDSAALDELPLGRHQLHAEELRWARRRLESVEKGAVIDAFHRGLLSQAVQDKLLADIDTQVLLLESAESDGSTEQKPSQYRADRHDSAEELGVTTVDRDNVATTFEERKP
jgi:hypothetical protein